MFVIRQIHVDEVIGHCLQDSRDSSVELTHSGCMTKQSLWSVMGAEVFPEVDICVLYPNVFTSQEVVNLETVFCLVVNRCEVVMCAFSRMYKIIIGIMISRLLSLMLICLLVFLT